VSEFEALPDMDGNVNLIAIERLQLEHEGVHVRPAGCSCCVLPFAADDGRHPGWTAAGWCGATRLATILVPDALGPVSAEREVQMALLHDVMAGSSPGRPGKGSRP
jgi:hypothetical protein